MATILLVDDSKLLLKHIQSMLVAGGHSVVPASSGQKAVELLATTPVDLVLTDLYMPPPDGFEVVDAARALPVPPALVVMSSSEKACNIFRDARLLGATAVLTKPFTADKLLATVQSALLGELPQEPNVAASAPAELCG